MAGTGTGTQIPPLAIPSVSVDAWLDEVLPAAQLCPTVIVRKDILNTCRDFCRQTELWEADHLPINVVAGQAEYQLTIAGVDLVGGERASYDGVPLDPVAAQALDADTRELEPWRTRTEDIPKRYYVDEKYQIRLVYIPNNDLVGGLTVVCSVKPLETATEVPVFLYNEYKEAIALGAKARLKMRLDMPWTDLNVGAGLADIYQSMAEEGKAKKFVGFQHTRTRDIVRTHYHDF